MKRASLSLLAFCCASSWAMNVLGQTGSGGTSSECNLIDQNEKYDGNCSQCTQDAGLDACGQSQKSQGKNKVCSGADQNGAPIDIWCPPSAGSSRAVSKGDCSVLGGGAATPSGALVVLGGLCAAWALRRRRRHR